MRSLPSLVRSHESRGSARSSADRTSRGCPRTHRSAGSSNRRTSNQHGSRGTTFEARLAIAPRRRRRWLKQELHRGPESEQLPTCLVLFLPLPADPDESKLLRRPRLTAAMNLSEFSVHANGLGLSLIAAAWIAPSKQRDHGRADQRSAIRQLGITTARFSTPPHRRNGGMHFRFSALLRCCT